MKLSFLFTHVFTPILGTMFLLVKFKEYSTDLFSGMICFWIGIAWIGLMLFLFDRFESKEP